MPEQHDVATSARTVLQTLHTAVLAQQEEQKSTASDATDSSSIRSALSQLAVCLRELLQRQAVLEQSLEDRCVLFKFYSCVTALWIQESGVQYTSEQA